MPTPSYLPENERWKWPLWVCFSLWSELKETTLPPSRWFWLAVGLANVVAGVYVVRRGSERQTRLLAAVRISIAIIYLITPVITIIGDGAWDLRKHLFFANVAFDVLILHRAGRWDEVDRST